MDAQRLRLAKLSDEYRTTMDGEVLHSWAKDVVRLIRESDEGSQ